MSAHGTTIEVDFETKRQLCACAQYLGLRSCDELAQIALHAFMEMYEADKGYIVFPLMLQQVNLHAD